ncbi:hypothetical protein C6P52_14775, partial [Enterococcus mundtii]
MGIFSTIFGVEKIFIRNKCLFFDQPLLKDGYGVDETQIFEKIKEILPKKKEILVKLHPRVEINRYGQNQLLNSALPFEVLLAENDFSNSLIISPISTISFSPSMMFEKKVHSILLAKLIINEFSTLPNEKKEILE